MSQELTKTQYLTALEHTKRGYGLWRGEVIHPDDPRMDEIIASGYPITDTKGLDLRYVSVRGEKIVSHFRVHDPEKFSAALDRVFPVVHDAVVRLVAADIRTGGFEALPRWCGGGVLPEPFEVAEVVIERSCAEAGVRYRPDICVLHPEGGRIELEVVNTHAPVSERLDAAWGAGHLVLALRIRDLVEAIVFSEGRGVVPDDEVLRGMLRGRRFRLCGQEAVPESVRAVWRDLDLAAYANALYADVGAYWKKYRYEVVEPVFTVTLWGAPLSALDCPEERYRVRGLYDLLNQRPHSRNAFKTWLRDLRYAQRWAMIGAGYPYKSVAVAYDFEEGFGLGNTRTPAGRAVAKLRRRLDAVAYLQDKTKHDLNIWVEDIIRANKKTAGDRINAART